jgi:mRNA interferase RelE/StbE
MTEPPRYTIRFTPYAQKALASLPKQIRLRITGAINDLQANPRPRGCKKLEAQEDNYRIRVGDYRVIYHIEDDILIVLILDINHRSRVYRRR